MKKTLLLLSLLVPLLSMSQSTFQRFHTSSIGGIMAQDIVFTSDNGYAITGNIGDSNYQLIDMFFSKTDANGNLVWTKFYQDTTNNFTDGREVIQTTDGGYILIGTTGDPIHGTNRDMFVIRTDASGDTLWTHVYSYAGNQQSGCSVIQMSDGGFVFTGSYIIIRTDALGNVQWVRELAMSTNDILAEPNGDLVVTGTAYYDFSRPCEITIMKLNASGDSLWTLREGGSGYQNAFDILSASDGGYLISGFTSSAGVNSSPDFLLLKVTVSGQLQWMKTYGDASGESCAWKSIVANTDGGYTGWGYSTHLGDLRPCMYNVDQGGNLNWAYIYSSANSMYSYGIAGNGAEGYAATGFTNLDTTGFYFTKTDPNGLSGCDQQPFSMTTNNLVLLESHSIGISTPTVAVRSLPVSTTSIVFSDSIVCYSVGIKEVKGKKEKNVFPNPCKDSFTLHTGNGSHPFSYELTDLQGKVLMQGTGTGDKTRIDITSLANGVYLIKTGGEEPSSVLLVKNE